MTMVFACVRVRFCALATDNRASGVPEYLKYNTVTMIGTPERQLHPQMAGGTKRGALYSASADYSQRVEFWLRARYIIMDEAPADSLLESIVGQA